MRAIVYQLACLLLVLPVPAADLFVPLELDGANSELELSVCPSGFACETNAQAFTGSVALGFDGWWPPERVVLQDFHLRAVTNFDFSFFAGALAGNVTNLEIRHAAPGLSPPFRLETNGTVDLADTPILISGAVNYAATGLLCFMFANAGLPCRDTLGFGGQMTNLLTFSARLEWVTNLLRFEATFKFSNVPLLETFPNAGTVSGVARLSARKLVGPRLQIALGLTNHTVSWPSAFPGFRLQRTSSLAPSAAWEEPTPVATSEELGMTNIVLSNPPAPTFYRLLGPGLGR